MEISPALNGFIKGLVLVVVLAVVSYLSDVVHLAPLFGNTAAVVIAALASSIESAIRDNSGKGIFGAVKVR